MPSNHTATKSNARHVWRHGKETHVSFPTLPRAFEAIDRLREQGRLAEYEGNLAGRYWVTFSSAPFFLESFPTGLAGTGTVAMKYVTNECPTCGENFEFLEQEIGRDCNCPHCGGYVRLLEGGVVQEAPELAGDKPAWFSFRTVALPVAIVSLLGITVLGIWLANRGGQAKAPAAVRVASKLTETQALAEKGDAEAQYNLGLMYEKGTDDAVKGWFEAEGWYRKAAEQGHLGAEKRLCFNSFGFVSDLALCKKAAEQGDLDCQYALGELFDEGTPHFGGEEVQKDMEEALKWYTKAGEHGHLQAQAKLGHIYFAAGDEQWLAAEKVSGKSRPVATSGEIQLWKPTVAPPEAANRAYAKAAKWYRKAAEQGDEDSQTSLGTCFKLGKGVPENLVEAGKWYRRAAEQGYWPAQEALGEIYARGQGVPESVVLAYDWLNLAAANSRSTWIAKLKGDLERRMLPEQIAEGQRLSANFVPKKEKPGSGASGGGQLQGAASCATAFFITEDGYALTASHAVRNAKRISLRIAAGTYAAQLVKSDAANDLALLKTSGAFQALPLQPSGEAQLGESVLTVGFPNVTLQGLEPKLTEGRISSLSGVVDDPRYFQVSVQVQPGNSGGALVDLRGNVVGIVAARLDDLATLAQSGTLPQNVNYAVKSSYALLLLESLPDVSAKLKKPQTKERKVEDVAKQVQQATAMVVAY
jgi:TPR repeat protein